MVRVGYAASADAPCKAAPAIAAAPARNVRFVSMPSFSRIDLFFFG
jgi:hypothetical protein